ncbi:methyltransferase domain-containing protein [bacterium]|nr:methyltransferase domain-containing protein [bacterium]
MRLRTKAVKLLEESLRKGEVILERDNLSHKDARLLENILVGVAKNLYLLDYYINSVLARNKLDTTTRNIARVALYQMLFLSRVPDYAIVSEGVESARELGFPESRCRFVNTALHRLAEAAGKLQPPNEMSIRFSHPKFVVESLVEYLGRKQASKVLEANNKPHPTFFRINKLHKEKERFIEKAKERLSISFHKWFSEYFTVSPNVAPNLLPGFAEGAFTVQNPAFAIPVLLLEPQKGELIVEVGTAPGGKLSLIAEMVEEDAKIIGIDISVHKLNITRKNLARLGLKDISLVLADGASLPFPDRSIERLLIDAPCSGLGVLSKFPMARYKKTKREMERLARIQEKLLREGVRVLKKDGILVFSTCTLTKMENTDKILFAERLGLSIDKSYPKVLERFRLKNFFQTVPGEDGFDGCFAVRFRKAG